MIDIDMMDEQLASALTGRAHRASRSPAPVPAPTPAPAPPRPIAAAPLRASQPAGPVPAGPLELLELGMLGAADAAVAGAHPRDALTWSTMRALLDGRQDAARAGVEELRRLAERTDDADARERAWAQRFWVAFEWGPHDERVELLDRCRERAYRFDDLQWWGHLALLLAVMGKEDEALRAVDEAAELVGVVAKDGRWLDALTNLVEAAALLGDAGRVVALTRTVKWPEGRLVVVGGGIVCKGSVDRYRGLAFAAAGKSKPAEECFRSAEAAHRALGAGPLLARTLQQASGTRAAA